MTKNISYQTIERITTTSIPKIKWSHFITYAYPIASKADVDHALVQLSNKYPDATHICYAYRLWLNRQHDLLGNLVVHAEKSYANDAGEPNYTAGKPILNCIIWADLHNTLIVVIRYYGGTNLGIGGLIKAYTQSAQAVIKQAKIISQKITKKICIKLLLPHLHILIQQCKGKGRSLDYTHDITWVSASITYPLSDQWPIDHFLKQLSWS